MPACPLEELKDAFEVFCRVGNDCAEVDDYNGFADLFTEDCTIQFLTSTGRCAAGRR